MIGRETSMLVLLIAAVTVGFPIADQDDTGSGVPLTGTTEEIKCSQSSDKAGEGINSSGNELGCTEETTTAPTDPVPEQCFRIINFTIISIE